MKAVKIRKHINLKPNTHDEMMRYAEENKIKISDVIEEAWEKLKIATGSNTEAFADAIINAFDNKYKDYMNGMRIATRSTENNVNVIIEALNTLMTKQNIAEFIPYSSYASPVITGAKNLVQEKVAGYKQNRDFKK